MNGRKEVGRNRSASTVVKWSTVVNTCVLVILFVCFTSSTETNDCKKCHYQNMMDVQKYCRNNLIRLEKSVSDYDEDTHNATAVCTALVDVYDCVGQNVPQCSFNFTTLYQKYHGSPFDCHVSTDTMLKLQKYVLAITCYTPGATSAPPSQNTINMTSIVVEISTTPNSDRHNSAANSATTICIGGFSNMMIIAICIYVWTRLVSPVT